MKNLIFCAALAVSVAFSTAAVAGPGGKWVLTSYKVLPSSCCLAELLQCTYTKPGKTALNVDIWTIWVGLSGCERNIAARTNKEHLMAMGAY